jgi:hypothetical protein
MIQFMQATYQNGQLILKQKLNEALEGKTLNIIVITEEAMARRSQMAHKKEHFLKFVDSVSFSLPSDYRFNRDELYAR